MAKSKMIEKLALFMESSPLTSSFCTFDSSWKIKFQGGSLPFLLKPLGCVHFSKVSQPLQISGIRILYGNSIEDSQYFSSSSTELPLPRTEYWFQIRLITISASNRFDFIFPKGGIEKNETPSETALRETMEEAGVSIKLISFANSPTLELFYPNKRQLPPFSTFLGLCHHYSAKKFKVCSRILYCAGVIQKINPKWDEGNIRKRFLLPPLVIKQFLTREYLVQILEKFISMSKQHFQTMFSVSGTPCPNLNQSPSKNVEILNFSSKSSSCELNSIFYPNLTFIEHGFMYHSTGTGGNSTISFATKESVSIRLLQRDYEFVKSTKPLHVDISNVLVVEKANSPIVYKNAILFQPQQCPNTYFKKKCTINAQFTSLSLENMYKMLFAFVPENL